MKQQTKCRSNILITSVLPDNMNIHSLARLWLILLLVVSSAKGDCDYDDDWCCEPRSWCEAFHFALYQFLISLMLYAMLRGFLDNAKVVHLAREMIKSGRATSAKVIAVKSKRTNSDDAPFAMFEYAALVEFIGPFSRDVLLKWVKINRTDFQEIKTAIGGELQTTGKEYPMFVSEANLQSLKQASSGVHNLIIYSLSAYPKSAVSGDPGTVGLHTLSKILYAVLVLLDGGMLVFLFVWFAQIYDYNLLQAGFKFILLLVVQIASLGVVWCIYACFNTFEKEKNFILTDTVRVLGKDGDAVGVGEILPLLPSSIV